MDYSIVKYKTSVVMSCYNGQKYLKEQLYTIEKQSVPIDEIVFVDDCSLDSSREIINDFIKSTKIACKLIIHTINKGYRVSFIEGILQASGDIIYCCDQDDKWVSKKNEYIISLFELNKNILVLNTNYYLIDSQDERIKEPFYNKRNKVKSLRSIRKIDIERILNYNISMGCTMAFKKEICELIKSNYDAIMSCDIPHDWIINIIGGIAGGVYYSNKKLIEYRLHSSNTIGLSRANSIKERIENYKSINLQHHEMQALLEALNSKSTLSYLADMIDIYDIKIRVLNERSLWRYIWESIKSNSLKYTSLKSSLYDVKLIVEDSSAVK